MKKNYKTEFYMKKLFKTSLYLIMGLVCSIFVACNDDDSKNDDKDSTIVGVWVSDKMPLYDEKGDVIGDAVAYMWYQQSGKFVEADCLMSSETGHKWIELSENGTWSIKNGTVTQTTNFNDDEDFDTDVYKFKIKGNSLFFTYDKDGTEITSELKRSTVEVIQNIIDTKKNPKDQD